MNFLVLVPMGVISAIVTIVVLVVLVFFLITHWQYALLGGMVIWMLVSLVRWMLRTG